MYFLKEEVYELIEEDSCNLIQRYFECLDGIRYDGRTIFITSSVGDYNLKDFRGFLDGIDVAEECDIKSGVSEGRIMQTEYSLEEQSGPEQVVKQDAINPSHYVGNNGLQAIEVHRNFMSDEQLQGYHLGNVLKYTVRFQKKNGVEDLKKARKHLDWLIEMLD